MTFYDMRGPSQKILPAIVAGLALTLAGAVSIGGVNMFGANFGFEFLPLIVLVIWPRDAHPIVSLIFVFAAGLFTDWGTGGIIGQWAVVFSIIWGFFRPELRSSPFSPISMIFVWLSVCLASSIVISLSGWFVFGIMPDFMALARQILLATLLLPIALFLRHVVSRRIGENEAWRT